MKMNYEEKKAFLKNLKNRMIKIESVIGNINLYENINEQNDSNMKYNKNDFDLSNTSNIKNETELNDFENNYNELYLTFQNLHLDNININKEEIFNIIKKHQHTNSITIHICIIKFILQNLSKDFIYDIFDQYNDFYAYIHSNSIEDIYYTTEYKKNIILSHMNFMKSYCTKIKEIIKLKEHINNIKTLDVEKYIEKLNKIEQSNELLFSKISKINNSIEKLAYKYGLMIQLASQIILKYKHIL